MTMMEHLKGRFTTAAQSPEPTPAKKRKRPSPLSVRLSEDERAKLEKAAAGQSLNSYVKECLFAGKRPRKSKVQDYEALAKALSLLGRSDLQTRLSALLLAIEAQRLVASSETERDIRAACNNVALIRTELVKALGLKA
ncbi:hypothetical protein [Pacificibacter sp. AS14]|uniref:hypothetical protein n=1 Tax=Pacificibacter sp. AS14 TaxID=3135785 RepID=UPI00316E47BB